MKSTKKRLFLPIEIIPRELDSKLLIAYKALQKGYSVVIGTKGGVVAKNMTDARWLD